jgi:hypothetical protein
MDWIGLKDPDNIENRNAGNGGDLGKHAVYLAALKYLLTHEPWSNELRVRECHAGRGMYAIPSADGRRPLLECLFAPIRSSVGLALHDVQRAAQCALNVWPTEPSELGWYAGSAVLNAWCLSTARRGNHVLELYELASDTRRILRALFSTVALPSHRVDVRILPESENESSFDGELHIENSVASWNRQDVVLLDPFAIWRQDGDELRRSRYRRIIDKIIAMGEEAPLLILFWTWGRAFPVAEGDLNGTSQPVDNGYQELRGQLHRGRRSFVRVTWRWGLQFAMWVVVPSSHLDGLCAAIQRECDATRDHLIQQGCGARLTNPSIEVSVDRHKAI